jgi:thymidylate synthase (FAD)
MSRKLQDFQNRLIYKPQVEIIANTELNGKGLSNWADVNGLMISNGIERPIDKFLVNVSCLENQGDLLSEFAGRFCYNSFTAGRSTEDYLKNILVENHGSAMEHFSISFAVTGVSRSLSHELIRHRVGTAISQESQRYVDARDCKFVIPAFLRAVLKDPSSPKDVADQMLQDFIESCLYDIEKYEKFVTNSEFLYDTLYGQNIIHDGQYKRMRKKRTREAAREYLPNAAETRFVWSCNLRELRHVLLLRGSEHADQQIIDFAVAIKKAIDKSGLAPILFHDIETVDGISYTLNQPFLRKQ